MARSDVRVVLDSEALREVLRGPEVVAELESVAEEISALASARHLRTRDGRPLPIEVITESPTDRAGVTVAINHPAGVGMEARHGVLRRAAEAAGLTVTGLDATSKRQRSKSRRSRRRR